MQLQELFPTVRIEHHTQLFCLKLLLLGIHVVTKDGAKGMTFVWKYDKMLVESYLFKYNKSIYNDNDIL